MALSTLAGRIALRTCIRQSSIVMMNRSLPMATSANDQMKAFWNKNLSLKRPQSPWTIYKFEVPMVSSLAHRITGVAMGVVVYAFSLGVLLAPAGIEHYVDVLKSLELGPVFWLPMKAIALFPLIYHTTNGARHLYWDFKGGYEITTQYKTAYSAWAFAGSMAVFFAALPYFL